MANNAISGLASGSTTGVQLTSNNKNEQIGKDEFLKLLVTQLKNQDPEAPMDSKEFAVQLAQFTQVEKLISIDDKLTAQSDASKLGTLAGYLGHQVVLNSSAVQVQGGQGGQAAGRAAPTPAGGVAVAVAVEQPPPGQPGLDGQTRPSANTVAPPTSS